jgi:hypothetical protein
VTYVFFKMTSSTHEEYTSSVPHERQPEDCALFHDVLQLNLPTSLPALDNDAYLAPLDGLSVLRPLPFEQCRGGSCDMSSTQELAGCNISY